ncbi:MAG: U32 family peptidase [Bacilli bacterium]|nr:U32 family peptidase [Bacilli bacterium]
MTELTVIPSGIEQIKRLKNKINTIILGIKGYSVNFEKEYTLEEIKQIRTIFTGTIFIAMNKNILNSEIEEAEKILKELDTLSIKGILFYDLSLLYLQKQNHYSYDFIWAQEHFTTNYATINYYAKEGVKGALISSDITLNEIVEIKEQAKCYLMTTVFGYLPMFASKRHLVDNYKKVFQLEEGQGKHFIERKDEKYRIVDNTEGTYVYSNKILNGAKEYITLRKHNMEYAILNSFGIADDIFEEVIALFQNITEENQEVYKEKIDALCENNTTSGFFEKETIYKVRRPK